MFGTTDRTRMDGRLKINDANYCRLNGWMAGTVLTIDMTEEMHFTVGVTGREWTKRIRITAIGEKSILVRQVYDDDSLGREEQWSKKLVDSLVIKATDSK